MTKGRAVLPVTAVAERERTSVHAVRSFVFDRARRHQFSSYGQWKHRPPLCPLDRRSHGPSAHPRRCKTTPVQQLLSPEAPPSPLSSRPERSVVERSAVSAVLPWERFSTGGVMGLRLTQGDEKRVLFSNHTQWKRRPPLCHLDRSVA